MSAAAYHSRETRHGACELKFLIDRGLGARITDWARAHLAADPHGAGPFGDEYRITSLYFDTARHDVLHARGSFGRSKYRVRRYGDSDLVFLERKLRKPGLLHKRRTMTPIDELPRLRSAATRAQAWAGEWFHRRLVVRRLTPMCQLSYVRAARVLPVNGALARLTLDDRIQAIAVSDLGFHSGGAVPVLNGHIVLELKYPRELPAHFKALIELFALAPTNGSKYRHGMSALGYRPTAVHP